MDTRYAANPKDFKHYTTEEMRSEFLIEGLFIKGSIKGIYSHVDRMIVIGAVPTEKDLSLQDVCDPKKDLGSDYFLFNREMGILNIDEGKGIVTLDGDKYELGKYDCLYVGRGTENVTLSAVDPEDPPKFYMVSCPAHKAYPSKFISRDMADCTRAGSAEASNDRYIYKYINPAVLETCQLSMGVTPLINNSVWMTMPAHTHERRMEVYLYNDLPDGQVIFHMMGEPDETRHIVMKDQQAVISPSWSIHSGCGTHSFTLIWSMAGENKEFADMDMIEPEDMK